MATGAKPALDPALANQTEPAQVQATRPLTVGERIVRKLTEIFEYNEKLGVTRS